MRFIRKLAERELRNYRENLEILVKERTQALSQSNHQLRHEIAVRKQAEEMIRLQATATTTAANGIMITDLDGNIIWVNPALCRIIGSAENDVLGKSAPILLFSPSGGEFLSSITEAINNKVAWSGEVSNTRNDGSFYSVELTTPLVFNEQKSITHFTTILHNITERVKSQKLLEYMATHDSLTNLPNRVFSMTAPTMLSPMRAAMMENLPFYS